MEDWKRTVLKHALECYKPCDIYNGDETALFYKCLPHRTYCFTTDKPAGSTKRKDRFTLMIITNMDGSDHRKLAVIGKAKKPQCLARKYKMTVNDMSIDWYASKNAWMTGDIHDRIMTKLNNQMREAGRKILYVCDNASCHKDGSYSNIKFLLLPPNATSILQPLDQGIILSIKRRYKMKLAEKYLAFVESKKDAVQHLKQLDVVAATNMISQAWRETSSTIIKNCFKKASFIHPELGPEPEPEEPLVAPHPHMWNKVEDWLEMNFEQFVADEPSASTTAPMTDEEIVELIHTENDVPEEDSEDEEDDIVHTNMIKSTTEFLSVIDQQKAFLSRNKLPIDAVEQLESLVLGNQLSLCCKQKEVTDYFSSSQSPRSNSQDSFRSTADISGHLTLVDSLTDASSPFEMDGMQFDNMSIDTSIASVAASALMRNDVLPEYTSMPKPK